MYKGTATTDDVNPPDRYKPSASNTFVILLGASEYPGAPGFNTYQKAYVKAADGIKGYFMNTFKLPNRNLLDVFDSPATAQDMDAEINDFLKSIPGQEVRDVIVYYIGLGPLAVTNTNHYLAIRQTTISDPVKSSITLKALAATLQHWTQDTRLTLLLDCSYASTAYEVFQPLLTPEQVPPPKPAQRRNILMASFGRSMKEAEVTDERFPKRGIALFCASKAGERQGIAPDGSSTVFTDALLYALKTGHQGSSRYVSLRTLEEMIEKQVKDRYNATMPVPKVQAPGRGKGDIARIPLFPNLALGVQATLVEDEEKVPTAIKPQSGVVPDPAEEIIGRDVEIAHLMALLDDKQTRIITLTGCSGVGKTRLAVEIARRSRQDNSNVYFIPLAAITEAKQVATEIATAVDFAQIKSPDQLINYFRQGYYLLVLDNFEHVKQAKHFIEELSLNCPRLQFLITSRTDLKLPRMEEVVIPVLPLSVPALPVGRTITAKPDELLARYSSVRLLVSLASCCPGFAFTPETIRDVVEICVRTRGLPLAIETIATHLKDELPGNVLNSLRRSGFLSLSNQYWNADEPPDILEMYQTIQEVIGWNYSLLKDDHKRFFRYASVFEGGFTHNTAKEFFRRAKQSNLNVDDSIAVLLKKGLLRLENQRLFDGQYRYKMLEIVRLYALDRLKINGEMYQVRAYHAHHFVMAAEEAEPKLNQADRDSNKVLERLILEYENFRAVLEWSLENHEMRGLGLRLAGALFWFWNLRGHLSEGRRWLDDLLYATGHFEDPAPRAKALYGAGGLAFLQSDYQIAHDKLQESASLWRDLDGSFQAGARRRLGYTLIILGMVEYNRGRITEAVQYLGESKEIFDNEVDDPWGKALSLNDWGRVETAQRDYTSAQETFEKSLSLWKTMNDGWGLSLTLNCLGVLARQNEKYQKAEKYLFDALDLQTNHDKWGRALNLKDLAAVYAEIGSQEANSNYRFRKSAYKEALTHYRNSLTMHRDLGRKQLIAECFEGLSKIAVALKDSAEGIVLLGAAENIRRETDARLLGYDRIKHDEYVAELEQKNKEVFKSNFELGLSLNIEVATERTLINITKWFDARPERTL